MVSIHREPMAPHAHLDYLTDVLSGLNVRHYNYLDLELAAKLEAERKAAYNVGYPWENFVPQYCWTVLVYEDGLDYDEDGNAYWDCPPDWFAASYHLTQKGAEQEAAYLEHAGIKSSRIIIQEQWQEQYDYDKPILP
ncbi:hypothetical protein [Nitrospira sp. BLG_2]|uniref:hypothetical protein n=1 Tax=Nitrospira sp. BLG_2 TaxID=3397507 RepID=UPI003B98EA8E